jgi:hypothetical protein
MVLPERIELSTSPLPRECSTTELRQRRAARLLSRLATDRYTTGPWLARRGGAERNASSVPALAKDDGRAVFAR